MVCEHIARQKIFPQRQDFCCSIWRQQLRKSLKHVDGFHIGVFLRTEIASRVHEHLYTCYNMPRRIWAALHSTLLCPFLGLVVSSHIWFASKDACFHYLAFEIQYPKNSMFGDLKRELLMHWIFLYLNHIPVLFLFLLNTFLSLS